VGGAAFVPSLGWHPASSFTVRGGPRLLKAR